MIQRIFYFYIYFQYIFLTKFSHIDCKIMITNLPFRFKYAKNAPQR